MTNKGWLVAVAGLAAAGGVWWWWWSKRYSAYQVQSERKALTSAAKQAVITAVPSLSPTEVQDILKHPMTRIGAGAF